MAIPRFRLYSNDNTKKNIKWESQNEEEEPLRLVYSIEMNTKHYVDIMSRAVDNVMPQPSLDVRYDKD